MNDFDIVFSSDLTEVEMEVEARLACPGHILGDGFYCGCGYCDPHGTQMRNPLDPRTFPIFRDLAGNLMRRGGGGSNLAGFTYL